MDEFDKLLDEHIKHISYQNRFTAYLRKITAAGFNPEIGIFWVLPENDKIVGEKISLREASHIPSQFKDIMKSHDEVWDSNKAVWRHEFDEYYEIPRGRLLFDAKNRKLVLISSKEIINAPGVISKIKRFFNISQFPVELKSDLHYENPSEIENLFEDDDDFS